MCIVVFHICIVVIVELFFSFVRCCHYSWCVVFFFFKQKTAYEMRISDWSSDVCSSDLVAQVHRNFYADEAEEVTVVGFLRRLCADLSRILDREIEVRGDEGAVPTILVQPIGLITNEFVTNAAKHAAGRIEIIYTIKDGLDRKSVV